MEILFYLNFVLIFVSLYVAFAKRFRPMPWSTFYFNLIAAGINAVAVIYHFFIYAPA
jgi:hypothetical protein